MPSAARCIQHYNYQFSLKTWSKILPYMYLPNFLQVVTRNTVIIFGLIYERAEQLQSSAAATQGVNTFILQTHGCKLKNLKNLKTVILNHFAILFNSKTLRCLSWKIWISGMCLKTCTHANIKLYTKFSLQLAKNCLFYLQKRFFFITSPP